MPNSASGGFTSLAACGLLLAAAAGTAVALWWEKRHPTSYTHQPQQDALEAAGVDSMAGWHALSTKDQEAADTAALDLAEQADPNAKNNAREAAEFQTHRVAGL